MTNTQRDKDLLTIRPNLQLLETEAQSTAELYQNRVLRPILKLQHELLIHRFVIDTFTVKQQFGGKNAVDKVRYVEDRLKTDKRLQKEYVGMITGLMTLDEYKDYLLQKSELDRRIVSMLTKRIIDGTRSKDTGPKIF